MTGVMANRKTATGMRPYTARLSATKTRGGDGGVREVMAAGVKALAMARGPMPASHCHVMLLNAAAAAIPAAAAGTRQLSLRPRIVRTRVA
jgi:hypothetical protein